MKYRADKETLLSRLALWDSFLKKRVRLIACGGTALTLLNIKPSTKDIDLIVPEEKEHDYLISTLRQLGYISVTGSGWRRESDFVFDLFRGPRVHTTELLGSPLEKGNHTLFKEFSYIYLGVLNSYDLLISKLFRGTSADMDDCLSLMKNQRKEIDIRRLERRFRDTASFDISEERILKNLEYFLMLVKEGKANGKR
ncbi:MAG: hypothetical protein NTV82_15360 [Candidatus Aminicenantes bacterium]|jgi:hypothetical protein|nr:hypothetical protein [Candidatus Aminicenantes bacterium]